MDDSAAYDLVLRVKEMLKAQAAMLEGWAESDSDPVRRKELWENLHYTADRVRDELGEDY